MGKEIASLHVTIGANTDKLKTGLAQAKKGLVDTKAAGKDLASGLGMNLSGLASPAMLAGGAIAALGATIKGAIDDTMAYTQEIKQMSMSLGIGSEEVSRLVQAGDDMGVSMGSMQTALTMMTKNGLAPSIDAIAKLADETNAMASPTERAEKLSKLLGRSWSELDPLLRKGGDAIRELAAAQGDGLVITQAEIASSEKLRIQQDQLNDSWEETKMTLGQVFIPLLADGLEGLNNFAGGVKVLQNAQDDFNEEMEQVDPDRVYQRMAKDGTIYAVALRAIIAEEKAAKTAVYQKEAALYDLSGTTQKYTRALTVSQLAEIESKETIADTSAGIWIANEALEQYNNAIAENIDSTKQWEKAQKEMALASEKQAAIHKNVAAAIDGPLNNAYENYWQTMIDLSARADELNAAMENLRLTGRGNTDEARALKEEYDGLIPAMDEAKASLEAQTNALVLNQIAANLSGDAYLEFARKMGLISESDYLAQTTLSALTGLFDTNKDKLVSADEAAQGYYDAVLGVTEALKDGKLTQEEANKLLEDAQKALDAMNGKVYHATIDIDVTGAGAGYTPTGYEVPAGGTGTSGGGGGAAPTATGASVAGGEPIIIGESGWEMFIPSQSGRVLSNQDAKEALSGGGGGDTTNYYIYNPLAARMALEQTRTKRAARANALM